MDEFGRYGVWVNRQRWPVDPGEIAAAAAEVEALGFGSLWIGGSPPDDLVFIEALLAATRTLVVGTSIVDVWDSDAGVLSASHERVRDRFPGRFYLGLGSSHAPIVEASGQSYTRPVSKLRAFASSLTTPANERLLAALGPKALATAREVSGGAVPYLVPPAHTADARRILGPDRLLIPEQKIYLGADPARARAAGRARVTPYLALPNYVNNLRRYGLTDADFAGEGSDRWVDTVVAWGDDETVRKRVDAHFGAGADHVAVQVLGEPESTGLPRAEWRAAARVLLG